MKKGQIYYFKDSYGTIGKGKFSGHVHHYGTDLKYYEIIDDLGLRYHVPKSKLLKRKK